MRQKMRRFISSSLWEKEILVEDMQKIVDASEKLIKELLDEYS